MPDLYTRVGEFFIQGVAKALSVGRQIQVPHIGECKVVSQIEPRLHQGNWSMQVDIGFPNSKSQMTIGLYTCGSCLLDDVEKYTLPQPTYEDETDKEFPPEHQTAWYSLLDDLEKELTAVGLVGGSQDETDYYLIEDYYPSRGISGCLRKPSVITPDIANRCQSLLRKHGGWNFWIQFDLELDDPRYHGHNERLLVREDRVVLDMNIPRLHGEFGTEFGWPMEPKSVL